jgi:hypothetical protein
MELRTSVFAHLRRQPLAPSLGVVVAGKLTG